MFPFHVPQLPTFLDKQAATSDKVEKIEKVEEVKKEDAKKEEKKEKKAQNNLSVRQRRAEEFIQFQLTDAWGM